jgi:hypothetical protein
MSGLSDHWSN